VVDRDMGILLQAAEKEAIKRGDQFVAGELFLLALADSKIAVGDIARANGLTRKSLESAIDAVRGGQAWTAPMPKTSASRSKNTAST
jgi:ATP-dependent Clp protease ATP-binding subunit ClpB